MGTVAYRHMRIRANAVKTLVCGNIAEGGTNWDVMKMSECVTNGRRQGSAGSFEENRVLCNWSRRRCCRMLLGKRSE